MRVILIVACLLTITGPANADIFWDGTILHQVCGARGDANKAMCDGYILGSIDQIESVKTGLGWKTFCFPPSMKAAQAIATVKKHVADNPQDWHMPAATLIVRAIGKSFPARNNR